MKPTNEQKEIIELAKQGKNLAINAFAGCAKAQPSYCKIQTPTGFTTMGEVKVGDSVLGREGYAGRVLGKFPQGIRKTFKVTFRDNSITHCNADHLWTVLKPTRKGFVEETVSLETIIKTGIKYPSGSYRWQIPLCKPVSYETKNYFIHPYLMGLLIGDGSLAGVTPQLSIGRNEWGILEELHKFLPEGYSFNERLTGINCKQLSLRKIDHTNHYGSNLITQSLIALELDVLSKDKHIPLDYKYGDIEQRTLLLKGLMDSDGSCFKNRTSFSSTSSRLIKDVICLVQSLGGTAIASKIDIRDRVNPLYRINVKLPFNPFHNQSKQLKWKASLKNPPSRYITNIEEVEETEQFCIKVDFLDNLYLTDEFIVTHNTSTCIFIAKEVKKHSLYLAFNKSIAAEAGEKFPFHVEARTIHSLAWENIIKGSSFSKKLQNFWNRDDIDLDTYSFHPNNNKFKYSITDCITKFCQSDEADIAEFSTHFFKVEKDETNLDFLIPFVINYWEKLINRKHSAKITPDVYLKLFQLSKPKLDFSLIYLDEAQDSNPVTLDIVLNQLQYGTQIIIVGDRYQAIYNWRGAINAFENLPDNFTIQYLTNSFRVNTAIAAKASAILKLMGENLPLVGKNEIIKTENLKRALLVRTNANLLNNLQKFVENKTKVYCLADLKDLWKYLYHLEALFYNRQVKFPHSELAKYKNWLQINKDAEDDFTLATLIKRLNQIIGFGGVYKFSKAVEEILIEEAQADITISTVHKSKGLEWDIVELAEDIIILDEELELDEAIQDFIINSDQDLELVYVALTRAKQELILPPNVQYLIKIGLNKELINV